MTMKNYASLFLALVGVCACVGVCTGCVADSPDDPGFNKPAIAGFFEGDVNSISEYFNWLEKENERRIVNEGDVFSNPEGF